MTTEKIHGGCLCGAVTYEAETVYRMYLYCFCSRCRKKSGTAHSANLFLDTQYFQWLSGEDHVINYRLPDADGITNCFCGTCGCRMPRVTEKGVSIPAGSLNTSPHADPDTCIYWDSRAPWLPSREEIQKVADSYL